MPRLAVVELVVRDLEASRAFYRRVGLEVPTDEAGHGHVEATVGGLRVAFDTIETIRSFDPDWQEPAGGGHRMALAFECDSPSEVDAVHADLVEAGYESHKQPWDAFWGMRYAQVHDPDGNVVDLFALLPQSG